MCKLLLLVVAYNAEKTIAKVLSRVPPIIKDVEAEILIIDDASKDNTFLQAKALLKENRYPHRITVLKNPCNRGYGGNQQLGYHYAILNGFDYVALFHGDGQYAPELLPEMMVPFFTEGVDAVFGSRMINGKGALDCGMPYYIFVGNRVLTALQNMILGTGYSEFHSGYRIYSVKALSKVPFNLNSKDYHFDTEVFIQFIRAGLRIKEVPIPPYPSDKICGVNGVKYAYNVIKETFISRMQDYMILYQRKYDLPIDMPNRHYTSKLEFNSTHSMTLTRLNKCKGAVLDIGSADGCICTELAKNGIKSTCLDKYVPSGDSHDIEYMEYDINAGLPSLNYNKYEYILLLDILEHLHNPEELLSNLRSRISTNPGIKIIASTGNIGFIIIRLMLMIGQFNHGKRGILDLTHMRYFTFRTFKALFIENGFEINDVKGVPVPFPLVVKNRSIAKLLMKINEVLIKLSPKIFSYQILLEAKPLQTVETLLRETMDYSSNRPGM